MPELPEVEVVRRDLEREIVGKRVKAVDADGMRSIRRHHNRKQFATGSSARRSPGSNGAASTSWRSSTGVTSS